MITFGGDTSMHKRIEVSDVQKLNNFSLSKREINSNISYSSNIMDKKIDNVLPITVSLNTIPTTRTEIVSPRVINNIIGPRPLSNKPSTPILKPQSITKIL